MLPKDFFGPQRAPGHPDYAQLSDAQLRSVSRFVEKRLRCMDEDHAEIMQSYRRELDAIRSVLFDRIYARMNAVAKPLSAEQHDRLDRAFAHLCMTARDIAYSVFEATKRRTTQIGDLTEIEAMALLLRLRDLADTGTDQDENPK